MLPALPASAFRFLCRSALLVPALLLVAAAAYALDADLSAPRATSGALCLDVSLSDVLPDPVENSLGRGMPATLLVHAELWRHRSLWFDRMERSADIAVRVRYEVWNDSYRMERTGASPRSVATLDSVRALLERPMPVKLGPLETLQEDARYFVAWIEHLLKTTAAYPDWNSAAEKAGVLEMLAKARGVYERLE